MKRACSVCSSALKVFGRFFTSTPAPWRYSRSTREALPEVIHSDIEVPVESTILSLDQESRISLAKLLREQEG